MADLKDGESVEMKGSGAKPYVLKNVGGVYSCSCPAWRNQSVAIERRTCKHLKKLRGDEAELARIGSDPVPKPEAAAGEGEGDEKAGPPLLLAERWDNAQDLAGWWMSEKLDGVRAYWDGTSLISRLGNRFHAARLVPRGPARHPARRRAVDRPQGVPAHRRDRPPAGPVRPVEGGAVHRLRCPGRGRRVRGPARRDPRAHRAPTAAVPGRPRAPRCAPAWTTSAPSWPASRRSAAKG